MPYPVHLNRKRITSPSAKERVVVKPTFMSLVHEFKKLVDHGLEEFPMGFEEPWVLANNVHNIRRDYSLVVFAAFNLAQSEEVLDNCHEEAFLCLFVYDDIVVSPWCSL
jgi:hypothetical protein